MTGEINADLAISMHDLNGAAQSGGDVTSMTINNDGYEKLATDDDVRRGLVHQMSVDHRRSTFLQFLRKLVMSIKTIEAEKLTLTRLRDFNLADAFKALSFSKRDKIPASTAAAIAR